MNKYAKLVWLQGEMHFPLIYSEIKTPFFVHIYYTLEYFSQFFVVFLLSNFFLAKNTKKSESESEFEIEIFKFPKFKIVYSRREMLILKIGALLQFAKKFQSLTGSIIEFMNIFELLKLFFSMKWVIFTTQFLQII